MQKKKMPTSPRPYTIVSPFCCVMVMLWCYFALVLHVLFHTIYAFRAAQFHSEGVKVKALFMFSWLCLMSLSCNLLPFILESQSIQACSCMLQMSDHLRHVPLQMVNESEHITNKIQWVPGIGNMIQQYQTSKHDS
jgi:hypothetical protein